MNDDLMSRAVREFRIDIEDRPGPDDARSGAGVHPARTRDGLAAYLTGAGGAGGPSIPVAAIRCLQQPGRD